jgi:hypothetical protein
MYIKLDPLPDTSCMQSELELISCRRLFLRSWKPSAEVSAGDIRVHVEIWVPLSRSTSVDDDLSGVLDYNVMRDSLLKARDPRTVDFISVALEELMNWPIARAHVKVVHEDGGATIAEGYRVAVGDFRL